MYTLLITYSKMELIIRFDSVERLELSVLLKCIYIYDIHVIQYSQERYLARLMPLIQKRDVSLRRVSTESMYVHDTWCVHKNGAGCCRGFSQLVPLPMWKLYFPWSWLSRGPPRFLPWVPLILDKACSWCNRSLIGCSNGCVYSTILYTSVPHGSSLEHRKV